MFADLRAVVRYDPGQPVHQLIAENADCRVVLFSLEPGQAVPPHVSMSTVVMAVLEGHGRLRVGEEDHQAGPGGLAACPPFVPHGMAADAGSRLVVLAVIAPRP